MSISIKGNRQDLIVGKNKISVLELFVKTKRFHIADIKTIEYQYADNSKCGFLRIKSNKGTNETFVFKRKRNEEVANAINFISTTSSDIVFNEVSEPFTINDRFSLWAFQKKVFCFAIIFGVLVTSLFIYMNTVSDSFNSDNIITIDEYNKCKVGMTYQECVELIGIEGEPLTETEILDSNSASYIWYGNDMTGANAVFIFQNDKLISKAQLGLE